MSRASHAPVAGFTLVEALVASAVLMAVLGVTFQILAPSQGIFRAQPEVADLQQRLRVGLDALTFDLRHAGAGPPAGPLTGLLAATLPAVVPSPGRTGSRASSGYRADAVSTLRAPAAGGTGVLEGAAPAGVAAVTLAAAGCAVASSSVCGFRAGVRVLVTAAGTFDLLTVADVAPATRQLRFEAGLAHAYGAGTAVVEVVEQAYWLEAEVTPPVLVRAVDGGPAMPIAEHVVGLRIDYFDAHGPLPFETLTDGPWRPHAAAPLRYDVDLLRVRRLRLTLRVEAADPFRGAAGPRFARGGDTRGVGLIPDRVVTVDVRLRNEPMAP